MWTTGHSNKVGSQHVLRFRHPDVNYPPSESQLMPHSTEIIADVKGFIFHNAYAHVTHANTALSHSVLSTVRFAQDKGTRITSYMLESTEG